MRLEQNHLVYCDEHGDTHRCFIVDTKGTDALHTLGGDIVEGVHYTRASDGQDPSEITIIRPAALTSWLG